MDKEKLNYEMRRKGVSISDMCEYLGLSRSAFYRKSNGISDFTLTEIQQIVEKLGLESPVEIFFAN